MDAISIDIEPHFGLNWQQWKQIIPEVERLGFSGLFCSDHFTVYPQPPDENALELIVALTYLAAHTNRMHFGSLVAPLSFRDPVMLARQAIAIDNLSGGRMILGVGAGWSEREHAMFGYTLGDIATRMTRFAEGVEIIAKLLRSEESVSYSGRFFHLQEAQLLPQPQHPGSPRLLIAASGAKRGLPLAACYADVWNIAFSPPAVFRELSVALDSLLDAIERPRTAVKRTAMTTLFYGTSSAQLERQTRAIRSFLPELGALPLDDLLAALHNDWGAIVGTPERVIAQIKEYATAGVEELILEWFDPDDLDGLQAFARQVVPYIIG